MLMGLARDLVFFFSSRRQHTRSLCDWSSDVCSSDLDTACSGQLTADWRDGRTAVEGASLLLERIAERRAAKIGRASCRERVEIVEGPCRESASRSRENRRCPGGEGGD